MLFKWKAVKDAELYRVFRRPKGGKWTVLKDTTALSYLDKSAKSGTWYCYTVRCLNASDKSFAGSYDKNGKTLTYYAAPTLTKAEFADGKVKVSDKKVKGVKKYRLYRKGETGGWKSVTVTTAAFAVDKSPKKGEVNQYTVRGLTDDGKSTVTGFDSKGLSVFAAPAPKLTAAKNKKAKTIALKWGKVSGAQGYEMRWVKGKNTERKSVSGGEKTGGKFDKLSKGKTYRVSVRAYRKLGEKLYYTPWSGALKVKVSK